jgi:cellulose synthase/poly-beta-1,6-N-acetylglucosamine synthase-like glycosyltransferase
LIGGPVDDIIDVQLAIQVALSVLMLIPVYYWFKMRKIIPREDLVGFDEDDDSRIHIILPMRNEIKNVERKISSIISEILPHKTVFLTVADSSSNDGTGSVAEEFLESSSLEDTRWSVDNFEVRGKNVALNGVIDRYEADIFVMSDADAEVSAGWLQVVRSRLSEENIGVVSGIEREKSSGADFSSFYRRKSNWLRINESRLDSTPVLEGSLLAWKASSVGSFRFDERVNADDAQIGLYSIKSGYRSIVEPRVTFEDFENKKRTFSESIRRAQGLSIALMRNSDLAIMKGRSDARSAIFNAIALYIFFPWSALFFVINAFIAFSSDPIIDHSWEFYSICSFLIVSMIPQGRSLIIGSAISIVAHMQAMIGRRYNNWEPTR